MHMRYVRALPMFLVLCSITLPAHIAAQSNDAAQMKQQIDQLVQQQKYAQAVPLLEKMVVIESGNSKMHYYLGFALLAQSNVVQAAQEKKSLRMRARAEFTKARDLGDKEPLVDALIQSIPADGSAGAAFSSNKAASDAMDEAEAFFSQGKMDEALAGYQKALILDPSLYDAALFSGDVYTSRGDWAQAEASYQRAMGINPNRETAYRYSATPLMKQKKYDAARDRYVEGYITEPYNRYSAVGLPQWANATNNTLGHPKIEIPANFTTDEKGMVTVTIDPSVLLAGKGDGSSAWIVYGGTRATWRKQKFAETFPGEKTYRHTLNEEADALRAVVRAAVADKKVSALSPALVKLKALDDKGLLEAYILLARPDEGIVADYPGYLAKHRDKLRQYVMEYYVTNGGSQALASR